MQCWGSVFRGEHCWPLCAHGRLHHQDVRHQRRPGQQASVRGDLSAGSNNTSCCWRMYINGCPGDHYQLICISFNTTPATKYIFRGVHLINLWIHISADILVPTRWPGAQIQETHLLHAGVYSAAVYMCQLVLPWCRKNVTTMGTGREGTTRPLSKTIQVVFLCVGSTEYDFNVKELWRKARSRWKSARWTKGDAVCFQRNRKNQEPG